VLGSRKPSTSRTNAFGARAFQPHMSILKSGSGIDRDLTLLGERFRRSIDCPTFDTFVIETDEKSVQGGGNQASA